MILKYMHELVASSSSDESLGEVDDEEDYEKITLLLTLAVTELYFR